MKAVPTIRQSQRDDYLELVKAFPLRVIRGEREYDEAVRVLSRLVGAPKARLSAGERQYADALAHFIEDFDHREFPRSMTNRSTLEKLKYLMSESGMTALELAHVLGASQPLTSLLLAGKRNLTIDHMRKLGAHFRISAGYFL